MTTPREGSKMQDQIATVGSSVSYYRGRFRADTTWSKLGGERNNKATPSSEKKQNNLKTTESCSEVLRPAAGETAPYLFVK